MADKAWTWRHPDNPRNLPATEADRVNGGNIFYRKQFHVRGLLVEEIMMEWTPTHFSLLWVRESLETMVVDGDKPNPMVSVEFLPWQEKEARQAVYDAFRKHWFPDLPLKPGAVAGKDSTPTEASNATTTPGR